MTDQTFEQQIQATDNSAPRVTTADIDAAIERVHYFTANDGIRGATGIADDRAPERLLTFCVLVLQNGFTVTGESACVSPENFDAGLGRKIAREKAVEKVWPLLGFRLRDRLSSQQ